MATNWSHGTSSVIAGHSITFTPNAGQLLLACWSNTLAATAFSGATIADTGSGGWGQIGFVVPSGSTTAVGAWWKVATALDHGGITITITGTGGSGGIQQEEMGVETFSVSTGHSVGGIDLSGTGSAGGGGGTSATFSPSVGSTQPSNVDELAWQAVGTNLSNGAVGTGTFTGTSASANLTTSTLSTPLLYTQYLGGVQASATAGTNVWHAAWTTLRFGGVVGATFYYVSGQGNMFLVL